MLEDLLYAIVVMLNNAIIIIITVIIITIIIIVVVLCMSGIRPCPSFSSESCTTTGHSPEEARL